MTQPSDFWTSTPLSYKDTGLTPGSKYTYQWTATDADGNASKSNPFTIAVTTTSLGAYAQDVVDTGAVHYWRLDEASGSVGHDLVGPVT